MNNNQKIGFLPLTALVTGNLVGSGVFLLPATLSSYGSISILGWLVTAVGAIILALIFAELSHKIPRTGGPFTFVEEAFGKDAGFFIAWGYWILSWISNAALLAGAAGYATIIFGQQPKSTVLLFELAVLVGITALNLYSLRTTGISTLVITIAKVIPLIGLPIIGLWFIDVNNFPELNTTSKSFATTLNTVAFLTIWAFVGIETGTVPGGQIINAKRNVPLATITGTLIATAIYVLGTIVIFGVIPFETLATSKAPYADAAHKIFGGSWSIPIAFAAIISCIGTLNGWVIVVGRIAQAAANDGLFPAIFAKTNKDGSPYWAVIISCALTIPFVFISLQDDLLHQFNLIIDVAVTFILFVYLACVLAFVKLFRRNHEKKIYRATLSITAISFLGWAFLATSLTMLSYSLILAVAGVPIWLFTKVQKHRNTRKNLPLKQS